MKKLKVKNGLLRGAMFLACGLAATSCVDDSWDLDGEMDMTMQLGTEGLALKLGNSENIYLRDILTIEEGDNLDTTRAGLYYLVEDGTTDVDFTVNPITTTIDPATLTPSVEVVNFDKAMAQQGMTGVDHVSIAAGETYTENADATNDFRVDVTGINADEIKALKRIVPAGGEFRLILDVEQTPGMDFVISEMRDVELHLPSFARSGDAPGGVYHIADMQPGSTRIDLGTIDLDYVDFGDEGVDVTPDGSLNATDKISMTGYFAFTAASGFDMHSGDYANVRLTIMVDGSTTGELTLAEVEGKFTPAIEPDVDPIRIGDDLPDFLDDDRVRITVNNPTVRFDVDMSQIPVDLNFSATANGITDGAQTASVDLPAQGTQELTREQLNTIYFYQGNEPFDIAGKPAGAVLNHVDDLSTLVEQIPDEIQIDLGNAANHKIEVQDNFYTIELGRNYKAGADYKVLVPLTFDAGLNIVYKDSVDDMNSDLQDYEADGFTVTATATNTIPLQLHVTAKAYDTEGREIPGITVSDATIAPAAGGQATTSDIELNVRLANRADLKRLEEIKFEVTASASATDALNSGQFLRLDNMRLRLDGPITGDFN